MAASKTGTLVDFARKTGADLALLEAKAGKPKRLLGDGNTRATDGTSGSSAATTTLTTTKRRRRAATAGMTDGQGSRDTDEDVNADLNRGSGGSDGGRGGREASRGGAEVDITDEFGRDRTVPRGGPEHRAHLEAKKAASEKRVEEEAERESYDERYSYRGNRGSAPHPPYRNADAFGGSASSGGGGDGGGGGWAWSSGVGRGADAGDFETREGQERRAKKSMAELLEREGAGEVGRDESGAKVCTVVVDNGCAGLLIYEKRFRLL